MTRIIKVTLLNGKILIDRVTNYSNVRLLAKYYKRGGGIKSHSPKFYIDIKAYKPSQIKIETLSEHEWLSSLGAYADAILTYKSNNPDIGYNQWDFSKARNNRRKYPQVPMGPMCGDIPSSAQRKLNKQLQSYGWRRRGSIKTRPIAEYSLSELNAASKLQPENKEILEA